MNTNDISSYEVIDKKKAVETLEIKELVDKKEIKEMIFSKISPVKITKPENKTKSSQKIFKDDQNLKTKKLDKIIKNSSVSKINSDLTKKHVIKSKIFQNEDSTSSESSESSDISEKVGFDKQSKEINNNKNSKTTEKKFIPFQNPSEELKIADATRKLDLKILVIFILSLLLKQ